MYLVCQHDITKLGRIWTNFSGSIEFRPRTKPPPRKGIIKGQIYDRLPMAVLFQVKMPDFAYNTSIGGMILAVDPMGRTLVPPIFKTLIYRHTV